MKNNKLLKLRFLFSLVLMAFTVTGCFEDRKHIFDDQLLEWEPPNRATNALTVDVSLEADQTEPHVVVLRIQYAGPHVPNSMTGVFEVAEEETSAVEGEHFSIPEKSVAIPANSSHSEEVEVVIHADAIGAGDDLEIVLRITEDSSVPPMENYKDFLITISKGA